MAAVGVAPRDARVRRGSSGFEQVRGVGSVDGGGRREAASARGREGGIGAGEGAIGRGEGARVIVHVV